MTEPDWERRYPAARTERVGREGIELRFRYEDASEGDRRESQGEVLTGLVDSAGEFHPMDSTAPFSDPLPGVQVRVDRTEEDQAPGHFATTTTFRVRVVREACPVRLLARRLSIRTSPSEGIDESSRERYSIVVEADDV